MEAFRYYFRRIIQLDFRESLQQVKRRIYKRVVSPGQQRYKTFFPGRLTPKIVCRVAGFSSASELASHLKTRSSPQFFIDQSPEYYRAALSKYFPGEAERIVSSADLTVRHVFDLLGSGPTNLDAIEHRWMKIIGVDGMIQRMDMATGYLPWHIDFKSGVGWDPKTFYKSLRYGHVPGVDVKVPWELSRFQHLIPLGQAYCITQNEQYAGEFMRQISDWIDRNPCHYGVNWACTMDVGIRAVNWIWAFYLFRAASSMTDAFVLKFLTSLLVHARFIRSNLEYHTVYIDGRPHRLNSNHYLANIVGLLYIALMFPELKLIDELDFARKELETELFHQTYPDGADYEHSTFYHRLVSELFLSGFLLLKRNGFALTPAVEERLQNMAEYVADYLRPDGTAPQIGDADNGRLHPLSIRNVGDHTYVPLLVAEEFAREDLKIKLRDPEVLWWIGVAGNRESSRSRASASYCNGGSFILRGANGHVYVSAAPVGMRGFGSHSHSDILSFEYWANDQAWLVDPGTYIYTPDPQARNLFRSTEAHNTLRIDGEDINSFHEDRLFQISDLARVKVREWISNSNFDRLDLEHTGYQRIRGGVRHRRCFQLEKRTAVLTINDSCYGHGQHLFEWFFHVPPEVQVEKRGADFLLQAGPRTASVTFTGNNCEFELHDGLYSRSYGVREPAIVIVARLVASLPVALTITISPLQPK